MNTKKVEKIEEECLECHSFLLCLTCRPRFMYCEGCDTLTVGLRRFEDVAMGAYYCVHRLNVDCGNAMSQCYQRDPESWGGEFHVTRCLSCCGGSNVP
jgi:hypothetical protein